MLINHSLDSLFRQNVLFVIALDEHITNVSILDLTLSDLDFCATLILQSTNCFTFLANDQTDSIIGHRNNVGR